MFNVEYRYPIWDTWNAFLFWDEGQVFDHYKAIEGAGKITISTRVVEGQVHVAIRDTGEGISEENLSRVFNPGYTTKGVKVGTGLGLSICYQIVEDHKGEIKVESELGKGTTFTVVLPMDLAEPVAQ